MSKTSTLQTPLETKTTIRQAGLQCALLLMGFLSLSNAKANAEIKAESLLIRNAQIISGGNPHVSAKQDLLISNGKIIAIGKT